MNIDMNAVLTQLAATGTQVALKLLGAIAIWVIGSFLINVVLRLLDRALILQKMDTTLSTYFHNSVAVLLRIVLGLAVLGFCGVETSSFAALLAAGGVAIGVAWSGLLANFAAGVFLVLLRPFRAGDFVTAGGVTGTVKTVGMFGTTMDTPDGVLTIVANGKIFSDTIQNFSENAVRRVDLQAQLPNGVDPIAAAARLREEMKLIPHVAVTPEPECEILSFTGAGPLLMVRPYTNQTTYWPVYFATNRLIAKHAAEGHYDQIGMPQLMVHKKQS